MKTLSTKVHGDTQEAIEQYAEEHDCSRSEAIRRLVRAGLDATAEQEADQQRVALPEPIAISFWTVGMVGLILWFSGSIGLESGVLALAFALIATADWLGVYSRYTGD